MSSRDEAVRVLIRERTTKLRHLLADLDLGLRAEVFAGVVQEYGAELARVQAAAKPSGSQP